MENVVPIILNNVRRKSRNLETAGTRLNRVVKLEMIDAYNAIKNIILKKFNVSLLFISLDLTLYNDSILSESILLFIFIEDFNSSMYLRDFENILTIMV